MQTANEVTAGPIGTHKSHQRDRASVGEETSHLPNPTDIFLTILGGEAQIAIEAVAKVVAVEQVGQSAPPDEVGLKG